VKRAVLLLCACACLGAGCGSDSSGEGGAVVSETVDNLGKIRSGELKLSLTIEPRGPGDALTGFELDGPFQLPKDDKLPEADIDFTQLAGENRTELAVISTGERAFACANGRLVPLPDEQAQGLRAAGGEDNPAERLGLDVESWVEDPQAEDAGKGLERVTGSLDAVAALEDVLAATGSGDAKMSEEEQKRLRESVKSSSFELVTGKDDRLLRELSAELDFDLPERVRGTTNLSGGLLKLDMSIAKPNQPVEVESPEASRCA
jgi:hypothetical protein